MPVTVTTSPITSSHLRTESARPLPAPGRLGLDLTAGPWARGLLNLVDSGDGEGEGDDGARVRAAAPLFPNRTGVMYGRSSTVPGNRSPGPACTLDVSC